MSFHNNFDRNTITNFKQTSKRRAESDEESEREKRSSKSSKSDETSKQKLDEYGVEKQALVIIYNQKKERHGTMEDVHALKKCFSDMRHFDFIHEPDRSKTIVQNDLARIAKDEKYKDYSYVIIIFLSHGDAGGRIKLSCDGVITNEEIWQPFCSMDSIWQNKPKFFIFQACKGGDFTSTDNSKQPKVEVCTDIGKWHKMVPKEADILVAYSTVEGNVSVRTPTGTWYIQKLCEIITEYGKYEDIVDILTRVNQEIANNKEIRGRDIKGIPEEFENKNIKQMPMFLSTLTKKFYFYSLANRT